MGWDHLLDGALTTLLLYCTTVCTVRGKKAVAHVSRWSPRKQRNARGASEVHDVFLGDECGVQQRSKRAWLFPR